MVRHVVMLRRYQAAPGERDSRAILVKRTDPEFIPGLLDGLRQSAAPATLGSPDSRHDLFDRLHLYQPVHRTFNLLLVEAACDRPTFPRLDPRKIESAGLVVRRVGRIPAGNTRARLRLLQDTTRSVSGRQALDASQLLPGEAVLFAQPQAWTVRNGTPVGWQELADVDLDPDPARRQNRVTANARINEKLAELLGWNDTAAERVAPLFVAPPDVCAAAQRTILYGIVPVTSSEASAQPEVPILSDDDVLKTMPPFLAGLGGKWVPGFSGPITLAAANDALVTGLSHPLAQFLQDLRLIHFGWGAFEPEGAEILNLLNEIQVHFPSPGRRQGLGDFLQQLTAFAITRTNSSAASGNMPDDWPRPSTEQADRIRQAVKGRLQQRLKDTAPPGKRFDDERAVYQARAFVRAYCQEGCPPKLVWSAPTAPFTIAPWWENGGPVHTISLPDLDQESVKKLKPNVAFTLPPSLAGLLSNNSMKDLKDGNGNPSSLGIGWICSFSLPAITLCAFIVLNIFLTLFNIIFQWLFFIKICLPFPKPPPPSST